MIPVTRITAVSKASVAMSSGPTLRMKLNRRALMACRTGVSLSGYGYAGTDAGAA